MKFKYNENNITYIKERKTFVTEASSLGLNDFPRAITLVSPHTGKEVIFYFQHFDLGPSNGEESAEILGGRYESGDKKFKFLIIND